MAKRYGGNSGLRVVLAGCLVLAACTGTGSDRASPSASGPSSSPSVTTGEPTELRFAIFGGGGSYLSWLVHGATDYERANPGVRIDQSLGDFYSKPVPYDAIHEAYFGDEPPDLVSGFVGGSLRTEAADGRFLDLTDLWTELGIEGSVPESVAELASIDGRRYWVPTYAQPNPIFYRTDRFDEAGVNPPETWDELLDACAALRAAGIDRPLAQAGGDRWTPPAARWFSTIDLALNGRDFHRTLAAGDVEWTDPRVRAVFETWTDLFDGCYGEPALQGYGEAILRLQGGDVAMDNLGEWIYENPSLSPDAPLAFFRGPTIDSGVPRTDIALVYGLAIPADSPNPDAARALLASIVSQERLADGYASVPRVILDTRADPGYAPRHVALLELLEESDQLVQLWEFLAAGPQAEIGLTLFTDFLAEPDTVDQLLAVAEEERAAAFGTP